MTDDAWLGQVVEAALEPELPICDPHHHLWERDGSRYLLHELLDDTNTGHNIVSTVFVECGSMYRAEGPDDLKPVGETEFVQGVAAMSASGGFGPLRACAGIVSHANLLLGEAVRPILEAHMAAGPNRFRGIRHSAAWDASPDIRKSHSDPPKHLFLQDKFQAGFAHLAPLGLTFDAWHFHPQISDLTHLARIFGDTTIVLDHFGGPLGIGPYADRADEVFEDWRRAIDDLATCENVVAKLGGINMPINGFGWHKRDKPATSEELVEATGRYYLHTIEQFGAHRCMFESNFPVDKRSCSYGVLWNAFKRMVSDFTPAEKAALFHDTATRVYRLGD